MKRVVLNSTPLIYLTKVGLSTILINLKVEKITSPIVKAEVVDKGMEKGFPEAIILEKIFEERIIKVVEPKDERFLSRLLMTAGIHLADAQVIALAKEHNATAIIDDEIARKTARIYNVSYAGTPYLLIRAFLQGIITKDQAKKAVDEMILAGWRCGPEDYVRIIKLFDAL